MTAFFGYSLLQSVAERDLEQIAEIPAIGQGLRRPRFASRAVLPARGGTSAGLFIVGLTDRRLVGDLNHAMRREAHSNRSAEADLAL